MNSVIAAPRVRKGFLTGLCRAAAVLLLALTALTAWPEAARAQNAQGRPTVVGSPKVGSTLTADTSTISDSDGLGAFSYQWYFREDVFPSSYVAISGATGRSYTIEAAQLGKRLILEVSFTDGALNDESVRSVPTPVVAAAGTANQRPVGRLVFLNLAEWPAPTTSRDGENDLRVGDWVQERGGNIEDPDGNGNLRAARESHLNYAWLADDVPVGIAVRVYTLTAAEVGKRITLRLTFTDSEGVVENATSYAYGPVRWRLAATGQPTITGSYRVGDTLTAGTSELSDPDGIDATSLSYQWLADDVAIANATGATYTLTGSEENKRIKVRVSFNDGAGDAETLTSAATGAVRAAGTQNRAVTGTVAISGAPRPGTTLRATPQVSDADGTTRSQFSYQWLADSAVISGATGTIYVVKDADAGKRISVRLTFTDDGGFVETITSAQTEAVRAGRAPTGRPGITGRYRVGDLLTAIIGDIGDPDGVDRTTFAYQWLANDAQISNATSKSYTLAAAQLGQRIKVRVTFTDGGGTQETLTSLATSAVVAAGTANQEPTGLPTISGTARVDQTLTANTGGIADADGLTGVRYSYEWLANDTAVLRGAGRAYTVTESDAGKRIKVRVTFTDDRGYVETLTSAETATVPAQASDGDVRLERDGRLFMYRNGAWGTVCHTGLSGMPGERLAQVVCRQLGRPGGTRLPRTSLGAFQGPEDTLFDNVVCTGTESRVGDCTFRYSTNIPCDHGSDVGISCTDETAEPPSSPELIISGTRRVGEVLTAHTTYREVTDDDVRSIDYQWFVDRVAVTGATATTYTVKASDQGTRIHVQAVVNFTNNGVEYYSSARTEPVLPALTVTNREPTGLPTITGTARVGEMLTVDTTGISDPDGPEALEFAYQWLAGGVAISTATATTYTVMAEDMGKRVAVQVSFTDGAGNDETLTSASTAEVAAGENTAAVTVGFRPVSPMPTAVEGGSGALVAVDVGPAPNGSLSIPITATGGGGAEAGDFTISQATLTFNSGETSKNVTVTAVDDAVDDDGETVTLGFGTLPSSASTVGALQTTITVGLTDNDERGVRVSKESMTVPEGGRGSYTVVLGSEPTAAVTVTVTTDLADTGLAVAPARLTFTGTSWTVAQTVTVSAAEDDNAVVEPVVTLAHAATGGDYAGAEVAGVAVTVTERPNEPPTGRPGITGRHRVGDTLTAITGDINDPDGVDRTAFAYQWLANDAPISNATSKTYTLAAAQLGQRIKVRVTFTDGGGTQETVTSLATGAVVVAGTANQEPAGLPTISGTARVDQTLTANTGGIADADGLTGVRYSYEWLANDTAVLRGAGRAYTVTESDAGKRIKVRVTFTDDRGYVETLTSAETATVPAQASDGDVRLERDGRLFMYRNGAWGTVCHTGLSGMPGERLAQVVCRQLGRPGGTRLPRTSLGAFQGPEDTLFDNVVCTGTESRVGDCTFRYSTNIPCDHGSDVGISCTDETAEPPSSPELIISGTRRVGEVLTAHTTYREVTDDDVRSIDYQWFVDRVAVTGATATTYTVKASDQGTRIHVQAVVNFTNNGVEYYSSARTEPVLPALTVTENTAAVTVGFRPVSPMPTAVEGGSGALVAVDVSPAPNGSLSIPITATGGGGAEAGDFTISQATLTFNSGETSKHVTVAAVDDAVDDDGETVTLGFGTLPSSASTVGALQTTLTVGLTDNDERGVRVSKESMTVTEGGRGSYTVVLGSEPTAAVTVTVTTDLADTGLEVEPASLTFTGTSWTVAQTVTVIAAEDDNAVVEPVVTLAHAAAGGDYEGAEVAGVAVTVVENDTATLAIGDARGREDAGVLEFVVSLSVASSKTVTVNYATADGTATAGSDYTGASGVLTFAPGVTDSQTIEVQITDDAADDEVEAETFTVTLSGATNAELAVASATGTIDDDDDPAVTVAFGAASYRAAEGGSGATVVLSLSADPERTVEIPLTAAAGGDAAAGDYEVSAQAVTFAPGETAKHVTVTAVDDAVDDEGESVTLGFGALPPGVTAGSVTAAVVALEDNDERGVRVSKESMTVPEGGRGSYTVVLGSEPTAAVTVRVTTDLADTGLEVEPARLTFTGTSWSVAQTVTVIAAEDDNAVVEPVVTLAHAAAGGDYEGAEVAGVAVTVTENDTPALAIDDARGGEDAGVLEFVVSLSVASSKTVTVNYATADGTATAGLDYTGASGVLTFAPGVTDSQTIEVQITDDAADDEVEAETFTVGLSGAANATLQDATGTGTIDDDDDPAVTVAFGAASYTAAEGGSGATVVLSLSADPERTVEIPLTAAAGGDAAAGDYEVSAQAVTFAPGETAKHVTVTAVDDAVDDEGESVTLGFGALPPGVTAGSVTAAVVALEDNDERGVRVSKESMTVPEGGRGSYTVVLGSEPTAAVTVTVTTDLADTGLAVAPARLTFTGTSWSVAQTVTVSAAEDDNAVVEPVVTLAHAAAGGDYEGAEVAGVAVTVTENDTPALAIGDARGGEDAGVLEFVVSLSVASSKTVTVNYATADGTATAGLDYTGASGVLTFAPGVTDSQTIEVQITDDAADDEVEAETFTVGLSGAANATLQDATGTGTIDDDDDPAVTVAFGAASYTAAEGGSGATVVLSLSADPERTVEIPLTAAAGGDAAAGDYEVSAQAVTFAPGETAKHVTVTAVDDAVDDEGESVTLGFGALPPGVTAGSVTAAVVALEDNDERGVRVSKESMTVPEGGRGSYTVVLGSEPTAAVTVTVTTDLADTGLAVAPASLTFTGTSWTVAQTVTVIAAEDDNTLVEPVVTLAHAAAGGDYEGAEVAGVAVTVVENDKATLAIGDARGREDAGVLEFVVSLSAASSKTVTVNYATADGTATAGSDYTGASGVLTFAPGVTDSQTIEVEIMDDAADDEVEAETFTVTLSGATNAELAVASATGTIEDDDDPAVTVAFGAASYRAAEGGGDAVVAVTLSADPERTVEIPLTAAAGGGAAAGDYRLSARTLTFESGATAREVTVTAVEDAVDDDGESVTLAFDALPAGVTAGSVTAAVVALEDNDERGVTVLPASLTVTEGGAAENYTVVLGSEPTGAVTVSVTTDLADTSVRVDPASLTFTAADWSTAQSVAVKAAEDEDALAEPVVTLEHVASGGDYSGAAVSGVAVTVVENDVPRLAVADATGAEGAGVLHFVVSLSAASSKTVTVNYATVDGTAVAGADYEPVSGRLTFTPGSAGSRTIEVSITDDAEAEDAETFTVELSGETNAVLGQASATGTIVDDDALNTPPAAVGVIEEQELTVGGEAARVDVSNAFADAEGDRLTYTAETADAEVATVRVAGTTVTVVPAGIGRTTVTVTASDSNAEATQRFVVVVGVVVGDAAVRPTADGGAVVVLTVPEAPTVRIEVPGGSEALDTDGDGDVDGQDELPTVRAVSSAAVPAVPEALRVRVDTGSAVDIEVPEQLTANGARVRVCLATSLDSERLALYRYDAEAQEWQRLESAVEQRGEQRFVCAEVGDFSVFAVFEERATDVSGADVNGDERIDGDDALVMYYAYTSSSLLGDGETGGVGRFRRALLAGRAGNPNPSDADLMEMLRRANAWRGAGADAGGDVNGDGRIDGDDALVMYYAYTSSSLLGDGETGGVGRFRQTLLAGRAGSANPSDADLMKMLRRANDLTERLR